MKLTKHESRAHIGCTMGLKEKLDAVPSRKYPGITMGEERRITKEMAERRKKIAEARKARKGRHQPSVYKHMPRV